MAKAILGTSFSQIKCEQVQNDTYSSGFLKRINTFRNNEKLCDVVLVAGNDGELIPAHRVVLAGSCAYFAAMFTGSLRESTEEEVLIRDISGEILRILVDYCYTGSFEVRGDTIKMIIKNADMLQLDFVFETCCNILIRNLHPQNCVEIMLFALQMNFGTMLDASLEFIYTHFMDLSTTEGFLNLEFEHLIKIISSDDLRVPSEEFVFDAVKKWLEYRQEYRKKYTHKLLEYVRLHLLSPAFIADNVDTIYQDVLGKKSIIDAFKYHLLPERNSSFTAEIARPRPRTGYFHLIALYQEGFSVKIAEFNRTTSTWSEWFSPAIHRNEVGVAVLNSHIIFCGGMSLKSSSTSRTVSSYDWSTKQLNSLEPMGTVRYRQAMIAHNGSVYAIGGLSGRSCVATAEKLNWETGKWVSCASMIKPRVNPGGAVINNKLYVLGGTGDPGPGFSVECFSTDTEKWEEVAPMNRSRSELGVAAVNGLLYVFGGCDDGNFFERYDPLTNKWTMCASLMTCTGPTSCAAIGNSIYISSNGIVREYDVVHNAWKYMDYPNMPEPCSIKLQTIPGSNSKDHNDKSV